MQDFTESQLANSTLGINDLINPNGTSELDRWDAFYANSMTTSIIECGICNKTHNSAVDCITFNRGHGF